MRKLLACAVVSCLFACSTSSVLATVIVQQVGVNPYSGFQSTGGTGDIAGQDGSVYTIEKTFTAIGDVPIILHSTPSAGVDTIVINERVRNNTGVAWTDFHFLMQKIDANPALNVTFSNISNPTGQWTTITPGLNSLTLLGNVPNGDIFSLTFTLTATSQQGSFDLFGIHEIPSVPEPTSLALLGCSLLGVVARRGRKIA